MARRGLVLTVTACLWLWVAACTAAQPNSVSGVVTDLRAADLTRVQQFSLRDDQGQIWTFEVAEDAVDENDRPLNASHLREHMTFGQAVIVDFRREGEALVAERVAH